MNFHKLPAILFQPVPSDKQNCDSIESYTLEYRLPHEEEWTWAEDESLDTNTTTIQQTTITNLTSYTTYEIRMSATNWPDLIKYGQTVVTRTAEGGNRHNSLSFREPYSTPLLSENRRRTRLKTGGFRSSLNLSHNFWGQKIELGQNPI